MSGVKKRITCATCFPHELESLKCIVLEKRSQDTSRKILQRGAWKFITKKFNADTNNRKRTTNQLKDLWKRWSSTLAATSDVKIGRRANIHPHELESLKNIVLESRSHNKAANLFQPCSWNFITEKYNADRNNTKRTITELQRVWDNFTRSHPSYRISRRRKELQPRPGVSSCQNVDLQKECKQMDGPTLAINVPNGCDSVIDVNDMENEIADPITPSSTSPSEPFYSDSPSMGSSEPVSRPNNGISKPKTNVGVFEEEYHVTRMASLREEHQLKMKVLEEGLQYWRKMNCNAAQSSETQQTPEQQTTVLQTYHLLSGLNKDLWN